MNLTRIREKAISGSVSEKDMKDLLEQYEIHVPKGFLLRDLPDNIDLSYPLVLKVSDPGILHKTDVGGVKTGIKDYGALTETFSQMKEKFNGKEFLLEEMTTPGVEAIIGVLKDRTLGQVIMLGMGGVYTELYKDTVFRLLPIEVADADDMVDSTILRKFTTGFRNVKISRSKLKELLLKVSELAGDLGEVLTQLDLNPVILTENDATVVDAKLI